MISNVLDWLHRNWQKKGWAGKLAMLAAFVMLLCCPCFAIIWRVPAPTPTPIGVGLLTRAPVEVLVSAGSPTSTAGPTQTSASQTTKTPRPTFPSTPTFTAGYTPTPRPTDTLAPPTGTPTRIPQPTLTDAVVPTSERTLAAVVEVVDGDTIKVVVDGQRYTVRYIGVDTPERGEQFGAEASAANSNLVLGKTVSLEKDVSETDRYDRLLRYVWLGDLMVNAELVRLGYANSGTYPPDVKYQQVFLTLERAAREAGLGFWAAEPQPTAPPAQPGTPSVAQGEVVIRNIFYDGVVAQVESDEYAEILNRGTASVNLAHWRLNAGNPGQDFFFPDFVLQPGQMCRVYTNEVHPETGGFSFYSGRAIWNNKGDCGYLYDGSGKLVSKSCY